METKKHTTDEIKPRENCTHLWRHKYMDIQGEHWQLNKKHWVCFLLKLCHSFSLTGLEFNGMGRHKWYEIVMYVSCCEFPFEGWPLLNKTEAKGKHCSVVEFSSKCNTKCNWIFQKVGKEQCKPMHFSLHFCYKNVRSWPHRITVCGTNSSVKYQKKRVQQDDVIKKRAWNNGNHVENFVEILQSCLFRVVIWGRSPHWSTDVMFWFAATLQWSGSLAKFAFITFSFYWYDFSTSATIKYPLWYFNLCLNLQPFCSIFVMWKLKIDIN